MRVAVLLVLVAACGGGDRRDNAPAGDGVTEIVFKFSPTDAPDMMMPVDPQAVRRALIELHAAPLAVEGAEGGAVRVRLPLVRSDPARQAAALAALRARKGDAIVSAVWSGERLVIRTTDPFLGDAVPSAIESAGLYVQTIERGDHELTVTLVSPARPLVDALGDHLGMRATIVRSESIGP